MGLTINPPESPETPTDGKWLITPRIAKLWLEQWNHGNRPLRRSRVRRYVAEIKRGEWGYNGEALKFSARRLLDGQHFLHAVVESGISLPKLVVANLDDVAFRYMDRNDKRSTSDDLHEAGEANVTALTATLAWVWRWERGDLEFAGRPSSAQAEDCLDRHIAVREGVTFLGREWMRKYGGGAPAAFVYYVAGTIDAHRRDRFFNQLQTGAGLEEGSSINLLRERLIADKNAKAKLPSVQKLALYIKAWNAFYEGRPLRYLRWRQEGDSKEPFPSFSRRKPGKAVS